MNKELQILRATLSLHPTRKWLVLITVLMGAAISALDVSIVNVALPTLKSIFGPAIISSAFPPPTAYVLSLIVFLPLFGRLSDVYGRSRLYIIGFVVFSAGSFFCGMSSTATFLVAARVVQAIGAGLLQANSVALIIDAFPARERGKAIGIQGAVQVMAIAVGPFVGGILIATAGWRSIFYINIPICVLGTLAALFILPPDRKMNQKERIDYLGAAFFASGLAFILLAFNKGIRLGWGSGSIMTCFLSGIVLLSCFIVTELKVDHPLIDIKLFKNATFLLGNLTGMLSYYVLFAIMFLMPFYLENVLGYSVALTGSLLTPILLAMAAVAPLSGHLSDKYGARIMTTTGMLVSAMACFSLLFLGEAARPPALVAALISLGAGMGLFIAANSSSIMGSAPSEESGVAGGVLNMTRSLGLVFGVNISAVIFSALEHRYLVEKGYLNVQNAFSNSAIPVPVKADAFMHGFTMVIMVLMAVTALSAFLSSVRKIKALAIIDHQATGTAVVSSGFFNGFSREVRGMALFVIVLLFTVIIFSFASFRSVTGSFIAPEAVAATARCATGHEERVVEADVRKNALVVNKLSERAHSVTENETGLHDGDFDLFALTWF